MSNIIPLSNGAKLPAYLANRANLVGINADVARSGAAFPVLSIKGKVFTIVKDGERTVMTRPDDPDEVLHALFALQPGVDLAFQRGGLDVHDQRVAGLAIS